MNYCQLLSFDIANCRGISVTLFVSGCTNFCPGCHNPEAQDFNYGKLFTDETLNRIIELMGREYIDSFVVSGGDPLHEKNIHTVFNICKAVKEAYPEKTIYVYTGYYLTDSDLPTYGIETYVDYFIDGPYMEEYRPKKVELRGSTNQRCLKVVNEPGKDLLEDVSDQYFAEI